MFLLNSGTIRVNGAKLNSRNESDIRRIFKDDGRQIGFVPVDEKGFAGFDLVFKNYFGNLESMIVTLEEYVSHELIAEIVFCDISSRAVNNGSREGKFKLGAYGIEFVGKVLLENASVEQILEELTRRGFDCLHCGEFDTSGYNPNSEFPLLQDGFCKQWRKETQGCRFCSFKSEKDDEG